METPRLYQQLQLELGSALVNWTLLPPAGTLVIWVESTGVVPSLRAFGRWAGGINNLWIENISAGDVDGSLLLSYWVFDRSMNQTVVLRCSLHPLTPDAVVEVDSILPMLESAAPFEAEISRMFGVRFLGGQQELELGMLLRRRPEGQAHGSA